MACTTVLVGKKASPDGSTMIARTDDGGIDVKKLTVKDPGKYPKKYKSVISHLEIDLPGDPLRATFCPSVDRTHGIWAATGINSANVGMTATETITTNPRVVAADPFVNYRPAAGSRPAVPGGLGEEDFVVLVLPYIKSAREGVLRLGSLLEKYGTYESNGIAFNDRDEVWWLETIGGHHWIAKKLPDDAVAINPNQFGTDSFDLDDALGAKKEHLCSSDLRSFIADNSLDANSGGKFDPRLVFGSRSDTDRVYNTPRAWFMGRYLTPRSHKWDGPDAEFTPESDNIPWCLVPDRRIAPEDVKYMLSSHYQGTDYDPYISRDTGKRGMYRSIGINRTGVTSICQIRNGVPDAIRGIEWICFGPTTFSAAVPVYSNVGRIPDYLSGVTSEVSTDNLYWNSRLLAVICDPHFPDTIQQIDRYTGAVAAEGRRIIREYDEKMADGDFSLAEAANDEICSAVKKLTADTLAKTLRTATVKMKNAYNLADN